VVLKIFLTTNCISIFYKYNNEKSLENFGEILKMSKDTIVKVETFERTEGKNPRMLRAEGKLPATVYGKGIESVSIALDSHAFGLVYKNNADAVFEVKAGSKTYKAVVQDIQLNYATNEMLNVEFKVVG